MMDNKLENLIFYKLSKSSIDKKIYDYQFLNSIHDQVMCFSIIYDYVKHQVIESFMHGRVIYNPQLMLNFCLENDESKKFKSELSLLCTQYSNDIEKLITDIYNEHLSLLYQQATSPNISLYDDFNFYSLISWL